MGHPESLRGLWLGYAAGGDAGAWEVERWVIVWQVVAVCGAGLCGFSALLGLLGLERCLRGEDEFTLRSLSQFSCGFRSPGGGAGYFLQGFQASLRGYCLGLRGGCVGLPGLTNGFFGDFQQGGNRLQRGESGRGERGSRQRLGTAGVLVFGLDVDSRGWRRDRVGLLFKGSHIFFTFGLVTEPTVQGNSARRKHHSHKPDGDEDS